MNPKNIRYTPEGPQENEFRLNVRDALGMDVFTRNDQILDEIRRLREVERDFISRSEEVANWKLERAAGSK